MTNERPAILGGVPLRRGTQWPEFGTAEYTAMHNVLESRHWAYDGPAERRFEEAFAELQGTAHARAVTNGSIALQLALEALDVGYGDQVIVPALTWPATALAVAEVNAEPVLVDVEPDTLCMDVEAARAAITGRTAAILVVHLYSSFADMDELRRLTAEHGLALIEDCAHAHGASWNDIGAGALGDLGTFSFQSSKVLTAGEGGCVTTSTRRLHDRLYSLRNCGRQPDVPTDEAPIQGGNHRMTEWQAAILTAQMQRFPSQRATREVVRAQADTVVRDFDAVWPIPPRHEVTAAPAYGYVLHCDPAALGLPITTVRNTLAADLDVPVEPCYTALPETSLYNPASKKRHQLPDPYPNTFTADPASLPAARDARNETLVFGHTALLDSDFPELLGHALQRLQAYRTDLAQGGV